MVGSPGFENNIKPTTKQSKFIPGVDRGGANGLREERSLPQHCRGFAVPRPECFSFES
jgi:hypothetical protein